MFMFVCMYVTICSNRLDFSEVVYCAFFDYVLKIFNVLNPMFSELNMFIF